MYIIVNLLLFFTVHRTLVSRIGFVLLFILCVFMNKKLRSHHTFVDVTGVIIQLPCVLVHSPLGPGPVYSTILLWGWGTIVEPMTP